VLVVHHHTQRQVGKLQRLELPATTWTRPTLSAFAGRAAIHYRCQQHKQHCWTPKKTNPDVIQVVKLSAHLQALRQAINNTPKHKLDIYRPGNKTPDSKACQHNASSYSVRQYQCLKLAQLMREQPDTKHADIKLPLASSKHRPELSKLQARLYAV
jgi:hypothetical protein